jgi:formyl-CoA transferase
MNTPSTNNATSSTGPLAGIRVLDLTAVVLGPVATQILGDFGADVIKVESPEGDLVRANGVSRNRGMSSIFLAINRNKRSVAVDLKSAEGRALLLELCRGVDVLVHNMRVAAIERLGLGYEAVRAVNPKIVYCVATGFAEDGPHAGRPAFDDVIQAACGLAAVNGSGRDMPDFVPSLIADKTTGLALANAVLAALFHRERNGEGQHVEVPMLETMTAFMLAEHLGGLTFEPATAPAGYARILAGGRKPSPTKDGFVAMLPYTVKHWEALFQAAGRDDLMGKYRLDDRHERNARVAELYADMVAITRTMTTAELLALCERIDVPATRIYALEELPSHPHLVGVGLFRRVEHPSEGAMVEVRPPTLFSRSPASIRRQAPRLGEHTLEVFAEAGVPAERLERLAAAGVLKQDGRKP